MSPRHVSERRRAWLACLVAAAIAGCSRGAGAPAATGAAGDLRFRVAWASGAPRAGSNDLQIRIEDSAGRPVEDADVSARWTMAAMGAMPEMRGSARAERRGAGTYEAGVGLDMNGTWQLAIEARRASGTAATLHATIATGRAEIELEQGGTEAGAERVERESGDVSVDAKRRQEIGIRTGAVSRGPLVISVRAVGRVAVDERRVQDVSLKVRGWITKLHVSALGDPVQAGAPLLELYSPDLLTAQQEYLHARSSLAAAAPEARARLEPLVRAAHRRLRLWDVSDAELAALDRRGAASDALVIRAPIAGFVLEKDVVQGAAVEPGARLFRIAPLDRVWIEADVAENQIGLVRIGQPARVSLPSLPDRRVEGHVAFVYPTLEGATRTARVRIEIANADLALRPDMYANVELDADLGERTLVPASAVLYAGPRRIVFVDVGGGRLRPREIRIGAGNGDAFEVLEGLAPGEQIVLSGNYLVASESRLKSALSQW